MAHIPSYAAFCKHGFYEYRIAKFGMYCNENGSTTDLIEFLCIFMKFDLNGLDYKIRFLDSAQFAEWFIRYKPIQNKTYC